MVVGQRVRVKVVKNKVAPPFRMAEFDMMAADGISYEGDVLDMATEAKLVTRTAPGSAMATCSLARAARRRGTI